LVDEFDNQPDWEGAEALYVKHLFVGRDCQLDLNGLNLYYLHGVVHPHAQILGGVPTQMPPGLLAEFAQLEMAAIPEPAALGLILLGGLLLMRRKRRRELAS
jgi:hypothetical protein